MDEFQVSEASQADIPSLVALINSCYRGAPSKDGWTTEADLIAGEIRTDKDDLTAIFAKESATMLKCTNSAGEIVGTVFLDKRESRLYLGMLSVSTALQASGIGKKLLLAAEVHAHNLGCEAIFMQVIPLRTELMAWYERNGYQPTGERKPFDGDPKYGIPRVPLEFVVLEKILQ